MRYLIPALVVTVVGFSTAHADPPKASPFSNKSLGEGGGYKHPDADVGQFFEAKPVKPAELKPDLPALPAKITPDIKLTATAPSRPRPRPFAPVAAKATVTPSPKESAVPVPTTSESLVAVKAATSPSAPTPAASVSGEDDSASEDARRDYESRLFGAAPAPRRAGLSDNKVSPLTDPALAASTGEGMLFVSLELDAQEAGTLRDAVAGLGAAAAFRPDARFQPMPGASGAVRISGWLPASRLGDAIARPGVKRVEVERGSRPAADSRITGEYLLKLRVSDPAHPEDSIAASVRVMTEATGFKLDRVFGFETIPGGSVTALVSGMLPVSQLSRALGLPGVIKITSASLIAEPVAPIAPAKKEGFLKFVMARSLWLVLLTVLLALPTVGEAVKSGLSVFVPYR